MPKPIGRLGLCKGYGGKLRHKALIHADGLCLNCYRRKRGLHLRQKQYAITFMRRHPGRKQEHEIKYILEHLEDE